MTAVRDVVWALSPCGRPDPDLVVAAGRAGALGVLDLGTDRARALDALAATAARAVAPFGVRVTPGCGITADDLPDQADTVVVEAAGLDAAVIRGTAGVGGRRVVAEVTSAADARTALAAGADGLVAKGAETGGRVGTTGAFVLLQQLVALADGAVPVWAHGGIGVHTVAAAVAGGAAGVVVDTQLALLRGSTLPRPLRAVIEAMDGSETRVVGGYRVYARPDLWVAGLDADTSGEDVAAALQGETLAGEVAVPVGQDGCLAAGFRRRWSSVGRAVAGLRAAVGEHLAAAERSRPLAPGNGVATDFGTALPVVQGPMTRVSDTAAFAGEVAAAGGMPFLALALLRGPQVRDLLIAARELLGERPWGVGILGFVPKDLRDEQLEVIRELKPPAAIIAGGRPSQAAPLEAEGITTYLHVPAPGLLERFLKDGARRFVLEGFECGGHVGPRSSFVLWESQVETLLAAGRLDGVQVLFAGGIHDDRSAAMVATLAGPLVEAGAQVGVVMGTAYLFTEAIVRGGAIGEEFQAQAVACDATVLLETAPGHATRCAATPYVDTFESTRRDLVAGGADHATVWAELESLNIGRLRLASKGIKREGDDLLAVDVDEQRRDGMYMIGDVATLHDRVIPVADLHAQVTEGATAWVAAAAMGVADDEAEAAGAGPIDIAIVGMACVMPGADDLEEFWSNVVDGVSSVTEVPPERWDSGLFWDPEYDHATAHKDPRVMSASKWGGFINPIEFDALAYGIPPGSLGAIEPNQLLSLKMADDALADAGYRHGGFDRSRTAVVYAVTGGTDQASAYSLRATLPAFVGDLPPELDRFLPTITEDSFPGMLPSVVAGRITNRLDLGGKNLVVDAACASSLAALDVGCADLVSGASDMVLCGGADLHNGVHDFQFFTSCHALSTTGRCSTFDASADGIALGEGVGCLVLKRLDDAERDGDRVYAVIKSVQGASDGRHLGLTAPRQEGQERSVRRAYAAAGMSPTEVGLVEAHGTGTVVGDRTELRTLTSVFGEAGAQPGGTVLGSVKSNIGHTKCAAGIAGLIKAAKAIYHGVLPPTLNITEPNPAWDPETSPFAFLDEARPWLDERRVAGVSAFGFGGTNFHVVLTEHAETPAPGVGREQWPSELFAFRGTSDADVGRALDALAGRLDEELSAPLRTSRFRLRDIASAVSSAGHGPVRLAIVADDVDDLTAKVATARAGTSPAAGVYRSSDVAGLASEPASEPGSGSGEGAAPSVGFLFPGQGSQRPGMVADLLAAFPSARSVLSVGERWAATMLPRAAFGAEAEAAQQEALTDTRAAQPALGIAGLTVARVLATLRLAPDAVGGHSFGELVALTAAGALDEAALLGLAEERAAAILAAAGDDPGAMAAASASRDKVEAVLAGMDVVVANDNHPEQVVVAGPTAAVDEAVRLLKDHGITAKRIPVACAFHSPVVADAAERLAAYLAEVDLRPPVVPVWANTTAERYPASAEGVRSLIARQVAEGVRFTDEVRAMYDAGVRVFVEVGPGRVLTGLVSKTLSGQPHLAVATDRPGRHGVTALLDAVAQLAVAGVPVELDALHVGRDSDARRWAAPAKRAMWAVDGHRIRQTRDGETVPGGVRAATETPQVPMGASAMADTASGGPAAPAGLTPADHVVLQYLQTTNNLIETGRQVILGYLGSPAGAPAGPGVLSALAGGTSVPLLPPGAGVNGHAGNENGHGPGANGNGATPQVAPAAAPGLARAAALLADADGLLARLVAIVAARTGYPADMLDPDLDVEADLSIDSIKRMEILAELADEIGLSDDGNLDQLEDLVEDLAKNKTLRSIVGFLVGHADRLTDGATPAPGAPVVAPAGPTGGGSAAAAAMLADPDRLLGRLVEIVAARTGYPTDMLDPDLDVEADLSIDSIKRMEILAELADEIGLSDDGNLDQLEDLVEDLAKNKTLRSIVGFLVGHAHLLTGAPAPVVVAPAAPPVEAPAANGGGNGATGTAAHAPRIATTGEFKLSTNGNIGGLSGTAPIPDHCYRYTVGVAELPPIAELARLAGPVTVTGEGPLAEALAAELAGRGTDVRRSAPADAGLAGTVVFADLVDPAPPSVVDLFPPLKRVLIDGTADVVFLSPLGGGMGIDPPAPRTFEDPVPTGAGVRALVKTSGIEYADRVVRLVDLDPAELADAADARTVARLVADELRATGAPAEVGLRQGRRLTSEVVRLHGRPPGTEPVDLGPLGLTRDSVVFFTGGARGITALLAVELARKTGCTIELSGRSPLPSGDEDPALAGATDRKALRGALVEKGWRDIKAIDKETDRILAAREVRATLQALEEAGSTVHYHQVDVRDHDALAAVVRSVYERRGRLDGVVAGAGIMKDALLEAKSPEVFRDVYATKVDSLRTILQSIGHDLGFLVVFSSVVGHTGNRGQVDYSTANDALDTVTRANVDRARRVLVVDWGPWDSSLGMIYDELGKVLESVGIGLVAPEDGLGCLLGDLAHTDENQLIVVRAEADLVGARDDGPELAVVAASSPASAGGGGTNGAGAG